MEFASDLIQRIQRRRTARLPPGPGRAHLFYGGLLELQADWLGTMGKWLKEHGPILRIPLPPFVSPMMLLIDPADVEEVFVTQAANFRKPELERMVAPILGDGLLLSEKEQWRIHRRLVQPAFHKAQLADYALQMIAAAEAMVNTWPEQGLREVYEDATDFSLQVSAGTIFGAEIGADARRLGLVLSDTVARFDAYLNAPWRLPDWIPSRLGREMLAGAQRLRTAVCDVVDARRRSGELGRDLIGMLMTARDEQGLALTETELLDELVTLFLAGAETTAVTLAWTLQLLSAHPDVASRVRAEINEVCGGRFKPEHLRGLTLTTQVLKEAMRLYPPPWILGREAVADCTIHGFDIRAGTQVYACPYWMQRDPRYFPDPERFWPERWTLELTRDLPRFAYMPFGGGQRICIGQQFAMMELSIALATIMPRFELTSTEPSPALHPAFTLRPRNGIRVAIRRIDSRAESQPQLQ